MAGKKEVLVTGGTGYIGSHTIIELLETNEYDIIVVDNLVNSKSDSIQLIEKITNKKIKKFYQIDLQDKDLLSKIFEENNLDAIIHFAARKAVGESVREPLEYYENNLVGSINLLSLAKKFNVNKFIFSSSATVYGIPKQIPITEDSPVSSLSPYAATKVMIEHILIDFSKVNPSFNTAILRYFNPIGAHPSGLIGEDPNGTPNNLFPILTEILLGKRNELLIYGGDYDTEDGTCIRDYVHVKDLATGHVKALQFLYQPIEKKNYEIFNLGTGRGLSVFEAIRAMEAASKMKIPHRVVERRDGDAPILCSDCHKAETILNWKAVYNVEDMCNHLWNYISKNFALVGKF